MIAVRYCSKSGNTEKVAKLIGEKLGVEAASVETPLEGQVEKLYLGGAVHGKMYAELKALQQILIRNKSVKYTCLGLQAACSQSKKN